MSAAPCRHRHLLWVGRCYRYVCCADRWWVVALPPSTRRAVR